MHWLSLLQNIGLFAIASGLLAWLVKSLVSQSLVRDLEAYKANLQKVNAIQIEEAKNRFTVGATSHMAGLAFDKHVQFCERYVARVFEVLADLFARGPHEVALQHANALSSIRREWALWLTADIEGLLDQFEAAIRGIGADAHLLRMVPGEQEANRRMFAEFAKVFGPKYGFKEWEGKQVTRDYAIETVITALQNVLGISELTQLRSELVRGAIANLAALRIRTTSPASERNPDSVEQES